MYSFTQGFECIVDSAVCVTLLCCQPLDKEGKPATLFTYDVSPGAVVQLFLKKDAAEVAFAEDEPMPASEEPAVSQSAAASSAAAASTQAETAAPATPSPATRNDVVSRVAVGVNDDGTIDCDQPPGTVHNTDRSARVAF